MSRTKRKSLALESAMKRLAGLQSIDPALDLGNGLTVPIYATEVNKLETLLGTYNSLLSRVDEASNITNDQEKYVRELSERMLEGVGSKYGHNSNEYEKAGGKRKSERKRPSPKKPIGGEGSTKAA